MNGPRNSLGRRFARLQALIIGVPTIACAVVLFQVHRIRQDADRLLEETRESGLANKLLVRVQSLASLVEERGDGPVPAPLIDIALQQLVEARQLVAELGHGAGEDDPSRTEHQTTETGLLGAVGRGLTAIEGWLEEPAPPPGELRHALERSYRAASVLAEETQRESRLSDVDIDTRARATRRYVIGSLFAVMLAAGAGLYLVLRTVLDPIKMLRAGAQRLERGDLDHRIEATRDDEVGDLGRAFNAMADELGRSHAELEEKVETRTRELIHAARLADVGVLAAGVAHEVNNPLASIASCGEALLRRIERDALDVDEARDYLGTIVSEAYRTRDITRRLLNLARADSQTVGSVDPRALFDQAVQITKHLLAEKRLVLELSLSEELSSVQGNPGELLQVLLNLILNARDASQPGGRIELEAREAHGTQTWEVLDHGEGIALDRTERVFDPFFTTKEPGSGTGLGLSLAAAIVDRHGGTIEASNAKGGGARFTVRLPVAVRAVG